MSPQPAGIVFGTLLRRAGKMQLAEPSQGAPEKRFLTWWMSQHMTERQCVKKRLATGDKSRGTQGSCGLGCCLELGLERRKERLKGTSERSRTSELSFRIPGPSHFGASDFVPSPDVQTGLRAPMKAFKEARTWRS